MPWGTADAALSPLFRTKSLIQNLSSTFGNHCSETTIRKAKVGICEQGIRKPRTVIEHLNPKCKAEAIWFQVNATVVSELRFVPALSYPRADLKLCIYVRPTTLRGRDRRTPTQPGRGNLSHNSNITNTKRGPTQLPSCCTLKVDGRA